MKEKQTLLLMILLFDRSNFKRVSDDISLHAFKILLILYLSESPVSYESFLSLTGLSDKTIDKELSFLVDERLIFDRYPTLPLQKKHYFLSSMGKNETIILYNKALETLKLLESYGKAKKIFQ